MKILFALSGSGGHIFPALSTAEKLAKGSSQADIVFLTEKNKISLEILGNSEFKVFFLDSKLARRLPLQAFSSIVKLLMTSFESLRIVREIRPDVVVGFGGYISIIPVFLAKLFRLKSIIHEQNVSLGRANYLLSLICNCLAVSFKATEGRFKNSRLNKKIIYTGLPLREGLKEVSSSEAIRFFDFDSNIFTILVLGGSQGSQHINKDFIDCLEDLPFKDKLQIIHISGFKDEAWIKSFYDKSPQLKVKTFPFLSQMSFAFSAADLCICRSGASTINELSLFKLPAMLIPYPGTHVHQRENAQILVKAGAAVLLEERKLAFSLKENLKRLYNQREIIKDMKESFPKDVIFNASDRLSEVIINI
ncbi:MAG: UDP-N-acetylglucosamine--N-acetylmuramyl-(pentapeptide) pyrophosphoryl-undecaprenol N-acetylglucosamine transferase [Candidatus Omnitrophota bacterium]